MTRKTSKHFNDLDTQYDSIFDEIANLIDLAGKSAARSVNSIMTATYWLIGRRIVEFE